MADLFQSHYDLGSLRRGVQDGETLWNLLAEDGTIAIVPDPSEAEVASAQEELTKLNEEGVNDDPEKEAERQKQIAVASRTSSFQAPPSAAPIEVEEDEDEEKEKAGNGRRKPEVVEAK
jgi:hypothetical protein